MEKKKQVEKPAYEFDDQGIMQVSQLISDSYNTGTFGQEQGTGGEYSRNEVQ